MVPTETPTTSMETTMVSPVNGTARGTILRFRPIRHPQHWVIYTPPPQVRASRATPCQPWSKPVRSFWLSVLCTLSSVATRSKVARFSWRILRALNSDFWHTIDNCSASWVRTRIPSAFLNHVNLRFHRVGHHYQILQPPQLSPQESRQQSCVPETNR